MENTQNTTGVEKQKHEDEPPKWHGNKVDPKRESPRAAQKKLKHDSRQGPQLTAHVKTLF